MTDKKPFYVLSTGRAGSTFLARLIGSTGSFDHDLHQQPFSRSINIRSNRAFGNTGSEKAFLRDYLKLFDAGVPAATCDPLQSMSLYYYLKYDRPEAKVVHLVRDPRDMVASFMNWKNRKMSGRIAHHLVPYWMPNPLQDGSMNAIQYMFLPKFAHYAWIWNFKNELFAELGNGTDHKQFRLEDIRSSAEKMNELFDHVGLSEKPRSESLERKVNRSENDGFPKWKDWTPKMCRMVRDLCGEQMERFGYGIEPLWQEKLSEA